MEITAIKDGKSQTFSGEKEISLLEQLRSRDIYISAACGGRGKCGKCRVQITSGAEDATEADEKYLHPEELAAGWRLACVTYPKEDCCVVIPTDETDFAVVSEHQEKEKEKPVVPEESEYDIAIDIGTTTIAIGLVGTYSGHTIHTVTMVNRQRAYGADVISRIQASNEGQKEELKECIRRDLYDGILQLLKESHVEAERVRRIAVAGNTTMGHLLMGYSCETLGIYPFTPVNIDTIRIGATELFAAQMAEDKETAVKLSAEIVLLPGISTYVGADIAAGLLSCGFDKLEKPCILIDLGTNGEMAIGTKERILVTSTAAGPAFEGGNISCGMGSLPGAICNVKIAENEVQIKTIGDKSPVGLCGTGVIETAYELVKEELVDETGMLEEEYFEEGFPVARTIEGAPITFTQKDVREIQLAKSAVRAGVETLLKRYGVTHDEIDRVFLAGGFGYRIDFDKTAGIGMLPREWKERTLAVGNSSLGGAVSYLTEGSAADRLEKLVAVSREIELSTDADFNRFYTEYMFFE